MPRTISVASITRTLSPNRRHQSLVSTPGLALIKEILFKTIGVESFSAHDEAMVERALELAWFEGAVVTAQLTTPITLNGKLP